MYESILSELTKFYPIVSLLSSEDSNIVHKYLLSEEYVKYGKSGIPNSEWYQTVHTFLLLVLESEGV